VPEAHITLLARALSGALRDRLVTRNRVIESLRHRGLAEGEAQAVISCAVALGLLVEEHCAKTGRRMLAQPRAVQSGRP